MRFIPGCPPVVQSGLASTVALAILCTTGIGSAEDATVPSRPVPTLLRLDQVAIQLVDARFVTEYEGTDNRYEAGEPDEYRAVVITLELTKQAGQKVVLSAPDLALHYYHGDSTDVLPCNGISGFSTERDTDRPMVLLERGYGRSVTGVATAKAEKVYVDVFFDYLEPDTTDLYLLLAQPVGGGYGTRGWGAKPLDYKGPKDDRPPAAVRAELEGASRLVSLERVPTAR
ncbi:MAG: hypothetical protein V3T33_05075 [Myxococcota bacterium]